VLSRRKKRRKLLETGIVADEQRGPGIGRKFPQAMQEASSVREVKRVLELDFDPRLLFQENFQGLARAARARGEREVGGWRLSREPRSQRLDGAPTLRRERAVAVAPAGAFCRGVAVADYQEVSHAMLTAPPPKRRHDSVEDTL